MRVTGGKRKTMGNCKGTQPSTKRRRLNATPNSPPKDKTQSLISQPSKKIKKAVKLSKRDYEAYQKIQRLPDGTPQLPFVRNSITVQCFGAIDPHYSDDARGKYILPIGFTTVRSHRSMIDPKISVAFSSKIGVNDATKKLQFEVMAADDPSHPIIGDSASHAWKQVKERLNRATGQNKVTSVSGPEKFGLTDPIIMALIQQLPNANHCKRYFGCNKPMLQLWKESFDTNVSVTQSQQSSLVLLSSDDDVSTDSENEITIHRPLKQPTMQLPIIEESFQNASIVALSSSTTTSSALLIGANVNCNGLHQCNTPLTQPQPRPQYRSDDQCKLEKDNQLLSSRLDECEKALANEKSSKAPLEKELQYFKKICEEYRIGSEKEKQSNEKLQKKVTKMKQNKKSSHKEMDKLQTDKTQLEYQLKAAKDENGKLTAIIKQFKIEQQSSRDEIASLKSQLMQSQNKAKNDRDLLANITQTIQTHLTSNP